MIKIEVKPVYEGKKVVATKKTVRILGVTVMTKKILSPECPEGEYFYYSAI